MFRNQSVNVHQFSMVPRSDIPRSSFRMQKVRKTTFSSGYLTPMLVEEVLPGDSFSCKTTIFARLATPIFPFMDNLHLETFFFFVPNRLVWTNWVKFMGEQANPADSISYTVPTITSPVGGHGGQSVYDQMGLPGSGQIGAGNALTHSALPLRAYNLIWNEWFRDENLQNSVPKNTGDGPDSSADYIMLKRGKRHDYFTSCLPWTQKGGVAVPLPLTGNALVKTSATAGVTGAQNPLLAFTSTGGNPAISQVLGFNGNTLSVGTNATGAFTSTVYPSNLYADLSTTTATTINALRLAFQTQRLLERDARGGTRYTELVRSHFGVVSPDARLQRPEYLGGGSTPVSINPIAQTSGTGASGTTAPVATLAAVGTALGRDHGFSQSFVEHGYVIGLMCVRADLTYQQGLRRHWSRSTRYDYYWPAFANLGEQAVLNKEIYCDGSGNDNNVFGYQERWAEYRYNPSEICGQFRSTAIGTLDAWHLAQKFTALPTLNSTFIQETPPIARVIAVPSQPEFLCDMFFDIKAARPLPMYGVPGFIDRM